MTAGKTKQLLPRRPLLWLATALLFSVPPMLGTLTWWVPVCFVTCILAKVRMELRGKWLRSSVWTGIGAMLVLGSVKLTYHSVTGLEPGLSIFILLVSLKILEIRSARDFQIVALLGWFLCLAGLFVSQDLLAALYAAASFSLILTALLQFHRGTEPRQRIFSAFREGMWLILQALPLVAAMFFLFPRGIGSFRFQLSKGFSGRSGMSDQLSPGSIASLALSEAVAFRVEFPDGNIPRLSDMYWRGAVLMRGNGLEWSPLSLPPRPGPLSQPRSRTLGGAVRQRIIVQPHGGQWVFCLDWPLSAAAETRLVTGNVMRAKKEINSPRRFEVISYPRNPETELSASERKACLQLPAVLSPRVRQLATKWTETSVGPREILRRALLYFHNERFQYSLSPGEYGPDGLEDLLFRRRIGFCEHYAAAFATLMRVAGVPSRVVLGYQGGEFNSLGDYLVVRQSDSHAWCEVWIPDVGWERVDPTATVAPGRVDLGFASFMNMTANSGANGTNGGFQVTGAWGRQPFLRKLQTAWDTINFEWDSHILNFDEEEQQTFLLSVGMTDTRALHLLGWLAGVGGVLVCLQSLWRWSKIRVDPDPIKMLYEKFCDRLGALGLPREPWEGPSSFTDRAALAFPAFADGIRRIGNLYIRLRYAQVSSNSGSREELAREIVRFCRVVSTKRANIPR